MCRHGAAGIGWGWRVGSCSWSSPARAAFPGSSQSGESSGSPACTLPAGPGAGEPAAQPHGTCQASACSCLPRRSWRCPARDLRSMGTVSELCASSFQAFLCPSVATKAGRRFVPSPLLAAGFPSPQQTWRCPRLRLHMAPADSERHRESSPSHRLLPMHTAGLHRPGPLPALSPGRAAGHWAALRGIALHWCWWWHPGGCTKPSAAVAGPVPAPRPPALGNACALGRPCSGSVAARAARGGALQTKIGAGAAVVG